MARILIIDDDRHLAEGLKYNLDRAGHEAAVAGDGPAGMELMEAVPPDLVLLDLMLPGPGGMEILSKMRNAGIDCPVVILSAIEDETEKVRGFDLGAVDYVTKPFDRGEVLARVRNQLRIRKLTASLQQANRELVAKQKDLDADLRAAGDIQLSLIPQTRPDIAGIDMAWRFVPCSSVGGDIFNVVRVDKNLIALYMVDVSGHGVPAAMVTVSVAQSLTPDAGIVLEPQRRVADASEHRAIRSPAEVLERLDAEFPMERFDKYFTMVYLLLDTATGQMRYCNAAHPHPVVVRRNGEVEFLDAGGTIVGLGGVMPFEEGCMHLAPGDRVFLFTDGITEFTDAEGEEFGEERLRELLERRDQRNVQEVCDSVVDALGAFGHGIRPNDDVTITGFEFRGPAGD